MSHPSETTTAQSEIYIVPFSKIMVFLTIAQGGTNFCLSELPKQSSILRNDIDWSTNFIGGLGEVFDWSYRI